MDPETPQLGILMFPWVAHGHIFPFLELAKRILARKNFHIYLCTTAVSFPSIRNFIQANNLGESVDLVELHLEPSPELPPHYHTTKNLPLHLNLTLVKAFQTAKSSYSDILATLKPDLLIYDLHHPWAPKLALSQGIPAVHFRVVGAATAAYVRHQYSRWDDNFPFPELCVEGYEREHLDSVLEFYCANVFEGNKDLFLVNYNLSCDVVLLKTSWCLEGKYVDYCSGFANKRFLPVGPLVEDPCGEEENSEMLVWLTKKAHHSTVYISFGSEYFLSKDEIAEIAKGVELCGVNFIWVIRFPLGEETIPMPEGFLDRVQDRGMIVTGWAPQAKILQHPSTGAFISHCGWSSITESLYFGVPIIAMPLQLIMFIDANMLVEAGVCVRVPRTENEGYKGDDIAGVMREVIVGKSGDGLRHKVQHLSQKMRSEEAPAADAVADHLWQLCLKEKQLQGTTHQYGSTAT